MLDEGHHHEAAACVPIAARSCSSEFTSDWAARVATAIASEPPGADLARAIAAYEAAAAEHEAALELISEANAIYMELGGAPSRPEALFYREQDRELGLSASAVSEGERRVYPVSTLKYLRHTPRVHRREVNHPATLADGFTQDDIDADVVRIQVVREPWPEAQARADEIVAAWDAWGAEHTRRLSRSGLQAAREVEKRACAARSKASNDLAWVPADDLVGILKKVALVVAIHGDDAASFLDDSLLEASGDDQRLIASIVHDLMLMAGARSEPVPYLQAAE